MNAMEKSLSKMNLGMTERSLSMLGGAWLLYNALSREKRGLLRAAAGGYLMYRGASGTCPLYGAILPEEYNSMRRVGGRNIHIKTGLTVNRPQQEVYDFWRNLENLPRFMNHLESVRELDDKVSEWRAKGPGDMGTVTWRSEIISEEEGRHIKWQSLPDSMIDNDMTTLLFRDDFTSPGHRAHISRSFGSPLVYLVIQLISEEEGRHIKWQSLPDSMIDNAGSITFRDAGKFGTEIQAEISYKAPLGTPGEGVLKMINPVFKNMVKRDIRNFKKYMETGEVPVSGSDKIWDI